MTGRILVACLVLWAVHVDGQSPPAATTKPSTAPSWLDQVKPLRKGDARAFWFRVRIDALSEQLVGYGSWAPPDHRAVVLLDAVDGLPVMVGVDGRVWMYDVIGGQVLRVTAEPEMRLRTRGELVQARWGLREAFPDEDSRVTIDLDLVSIVRALAEEPKATLKLEETPKRVAEATATGRLVRLEASASDPTVPAAFVLQMGEPPRKATLTVDSIRVGEAMPAWHKAVDEKALEAKGLTVLVVDEAKGLASPVRDRLDKFQRVLHASGIFVMRPCLRDVATRNRFENRGVVSLNFEEMQANDERMRGPWREALKGQGMVFGEMEKPGK